MQAVYKPFKPLKGVPTLVVRSRRAGTDSVDRRSAYVGNVDYGTSPENLHEHFKSCGEVKRITILVDKFTGHPKGFAYVEFGDDRAMQNALLFDGTLLRGRQLKVVQKRTNIPFMHAKGEGTMGKGTATNRKGKGSQPFYDPYYFHPWAPGYGYWPAKGYKGHGTYSAPY